MTLDELALSVNWAFGLVIDDESIKGLAVIAARQYSTWGQLSGVVPDADDLASIVGTLLVTSSEWGVIKPLFSLYVERENARALEASRGNGVDVYGRAVSEIDQSITQYETIDMPRAAFIELPESV